VTVLLDAGVKASILVEALPYIRRFWGRVVVVKYGGNAIGDSDSLASFAEDVVLMRSVGMRPVVVHGGGPQIGDLMERLGKTPVFREGLRVTDAETLDIARMVLVGKVNRDIVGAINVHAAIAVGISGEDAGLLRATARSEELGFVGDVAAVDASIIERLLTQELIPVVATIGSDDTGQAYNINADTAAGAIAVALGAEKLVYLTDIEGIRRDVTDPDSLVRRASVAEVREMLGGGAVGEGMIPKVESCVSAVERGVGHAHILDGRAPHALLLEFFTDEGVGTMVER
jgi:acetylglutamate kinase